MQRCLERQAQGFELIPRFRFRFINEEGRTEHERIEFRDATKLGNWRRSQEGKGKRTSCDPSIIALLDKHLIGWKDKRPLKSSNVQALDDAKELVRRCYDRSKKGRNLIPQHVRKKNRWTFLSLIQTICCLLCI